MKSNETLFNNLARVPTLNELEKLSKKHQDIYLMKCEIKRGIQPVLLISFYDEPSMLIYFDINGNAFREKLDKNDPFEPVVPQEHLHLFFTEIKPKLILDRLNSMTNQNDFWELAENYNLTRVQVGKEDGANAFYLVYGTGEYEPNPNFWCFFFDDQGTKITKEEYETRYDKNHEFKFFTVYNKIYDKDISAH